LLESENSLLKTNGWS